MSSANADETQPLLSVGSSQNAFADLPSSNSSVTLLTQPEAGPPLSVNREGLVPLLKSLLVDSVPVTLSYVLQNSIQTVSVLIVGRLGPHELSVAAFSFMLATIGWCVALGGTTALDTLGSQAFAGGDPKSLSVHFQRCLVLLWLLFIPVGFLWANLEPVLLLLGQQPDLSRDVQRFMTVLILGAPGYIGFESLKKYLQCQGIMRASTVVLILVSPVNLGLNVFFVHYTSLGFLGSPVAISATFTLCFLILGTFTYFSPAHRANEAWITANVATVFDLRSCVQCLSLAIPGILMVGTEWAAFEIVALAAGHLGALPLAAQSVIMTADQVLNNIPFGIGVAASTRVGRLIGGQHAQGAKRASHASALLSAIVGVVIMTTLLACKNVFGYAISEDRNVVQLVSKIMPLVASFQICDCLAGSCGGVLRGLGRQHLGAIFNLVAYYVLALPMGIALAFLPQTQLGLQGLWIGQVVALTIIALGEYAVVWLAIDWEREVQLSIERNEAEAKRLHLHEHADQFN
ncbi:MATE efflux family protein [Fomitopsis serialis]|uniref:MATE efflux family protein n=1 Tax=Fomitopsis serialis TaxID=139415 RepID=UPI002008035B|nr:MATE efflux family protein [Neoantrodia serialis]KAH9920427.1 MATE efflux family protein [Neoantrodia serialis]